MKNWKIITLIGVLFILLVVIYARNIILSPPEYIVTHHLATDLYGHFLHAIERAKLVFNGFLPFGDYWVQRGGGYPAASNDQLIAQHEYLMSIIYMLTGSVTVALKILIPLFYIATLGMAYWYGMVLFKNRVMSVVLAVSYGFCVYGINQLEHLELIGTQPFILWVLIFTEKCLVKPTSKNIIWASIGLLFVFLSNLYTLYFLLIFLSFRFIYALFQYNKWEIFKSYVKILGLGLLLCLPLFIPQIMQLPSSNLQELLKTAITSYSRPLGLLLYRNPPYVSYNTEIYFMYIGIVVALLALVPVILKTNKYRGLYIFNVIVALFYIIWANGSSGSFNLNSVLPLSYFIEVPGRSMIIGYLALGICVAIGFNELYNRIKTARLRIGFAFIAVVIIFIDLTIGFEPTVMQPYFKENAITEYLHKQDGDFRIIEIPSVHDQQAMTEIYTEHDVLNKVVWAYGHFEPLNTFADVYNNYLKENETAEQSAYYGVRYVVINLDPVYYDTFKQAIKSINTSDYEQTLKIQKYIEQSDDYKMVYTSNNQYIYENQRYQGLVFGNNAKVSYYRPDNDNLIIYANASQPTTLTISQSFAPGWKAELNGNKTVIKEANSINEIEIPQGLSTIKMNYTRHTISLFYTFGFWLLAVIVAILFVRFDKCRKL